MAANTDIKFLLVVLDNVTITPSFANKAIEKWPSELCTAPVDGKDLGRRIEQLWQKWIGDGVASSSVSTAGSASGADEDSTLGPAKEDSAGIARPDVIVIDDDSDDEIKKPNTRILPRKFRVPPAAGLITPRHEQSTPTIDRARSAVMDNAAAFPTPQSLGKQAATKSTKNVKSSIKAADTKVRSARAKGKEKVVHDDSSKPDEEDFKDPFSLAFNRKRRRMTDYDYVPEDKVYDRADENDDDFEYEKHDDDERLDKKFEKDWPELPTPSKRQKKTKR